MYVYRANDVCILIEKIWAEQLGQDSHKNVYRVNDVLSHRSIDLWAIEQMVDKTNGTRSNGHRANGNRADVVAPSVLSFELLLSLKSDF